MSRNLAAELGDVSFSAVQRFWRRHGAAMWKTRRSVASGTSLRISTSLGRTFSQSTSTWICTRAIAAVALSAACEVYHLIEPLGVPGVRSSAEMMRIVEFKFLLSL